MANPRILAFYITICCVSFVISKIVISVLLYWRWSRKKQVFEDSTSGGKMVMFRSPVIQSLTSEVFLKKTMKLSNKDIIGFGGFATVYKLVIDDSTAFAVKKLNRSSLGRDTGFERELEAMGDIKHRNIVTLHGYYTAPQFNLLICELMPNGSLDAHLHGKVSERKILHWPLRYKIAMGAARGIAYLHHDCIPHIIHRDIKSSNILLDKNMEARVSDFGLATLMKPDQTHVSTCVAGTFGYLAPGILFAEYIDTGRATEKGDVYSYGVLLLEILTGKRPTDETFIEHGSKLVNWVKAVVEEGREVDVVDRELVNVSIEEIKSVFGIVIKCLDQDPSKRPTMGEVVKNLEQGKLVLEVCT
ncbi:receptor-like serine/threonine-protein kinase At1g78530 isoform X2 [Amborella trichopoda]|uniref:receptor-like serine/threonine-protein kinase At1g78530 isoform X2 n=1 Tax=Amborella trichopoda TaxID=13333 RepID=UPI0005D431D3|nr:receptor-like serine/threonine-protein kinase At1g78530 isoform X2 [Amborella trichopoda]|eukprot:XP_011624512.1 receptor-like serine/threonine-protein kinase At1g78530 isoform X2 [Amborella trichopoda]